MNNKAFTLIELTAIIVVLAAIFLVSFPALINTAKSDENRKYDDMVEDLCLAGKSYIYANMDDFPELSTPNSKIYLNIASLIQYESVNKDIRNPKTEDVVNSHFVVFNVLADNSVECEYRDAKCLVTKDVGEKGLSEWDEVMCGTESFNIIRNNENYPSETEDVTLLAKYNLNVGAHIQEGIPGIQNKNAIGTSFYDDLNINYDECNFTEKALTTYITLNGWTPESQIEFYKLGYGCKATVPFSETPYWKNQENLEDGTFIYDDRSLLYPYVQNYKKYMEKLGLDVKEATIPSYYQLELELENPDGEYGEDLENASRLDNSSFWLGSLSTRNCESKDCIYHVDIKSSYSDMQYYRSIYYGIRPVIIISKDDIEF